MKKNFKIFILGLVFAIATFVRIWQVVQIPAGFNADEAALGYNAYSILKTGKDEFGNFLPVAFTSFGDYKPPLYVYVTVPFVALFGLEEFAVRFPSVVFGVLTVLLTYFIAKKISNNDYIAILSGLFLAISPWHIHYSRGGWETNLFTFLLTLGIYLFIKASQKPVYLVFAAIVFGLSFYSYQAARLIMPIVVVFLFFFYIKKLIPLKKHLIISTFIGFLILVPALITFVSGSGLSRFWGVSIFADSGPFWEVNQRRGDHQDPGSITTQILHNKIQAYSKVYLKNYFAHFDAEFLFIKGDTIARNRFIDHGTLLLVSLPFLLFGVYFLIKKEKNWPLVFLWLLASPTASALTFQSPQALRSALMVVPISIITAFGFYYFFNSLKSKKIRSILLIITVLFFTYNFARFLHYYFVHNPKQIPIAFQPGFAELVPFITGVQDDYDKVIITDKYDQPYILFLFYQKPDPANYHGILQLTQRDKFGFSTVKNLDNLEFRTLNKEDFSSSDKLLYVGTPEEIDQVRSNVKVIKTIDYPNSKPAFEIVENI